MTQNKSFSITSSVEFIFEDSQTRDFSYNSYLPELDIIKTERSKILMEKISTNSIVFQIECTDITAFRASISDIIGFGKIIENLLKISKS